jgi:hypothetical protein
MKSSAYRIHVCPKNALGQTRGRKPVEALRALLVRLSGEGGVRRILQPTHRRASHWQHGGEPNGSDARRQARHDLRGQYAERDLPFMNGIGVAVIEDPYTDAARIDREGNLDVGARLEQAQHHDGTIAEGAPGWTPPQRPRITVITALRDDPLGRMYARRQIDRAQFDAGKEYQSLCDPPSSPACARSIQRRPASTVVAFRIYSPSRGSARPSSCAASMRH